jgi:hypothetical protein
MIAQAAGRLNKRSIGSALEKRLLHLGPAQAIVPFDEKPWLRVTDKLHGAAFTVI